jgi:hypothetical protein
VPAPRKSAAGLVRSAKARNTIALGAPRRAAAAIIAFMILAGVAAAAIPSSPLHRLIVDALTGKRTQPASVGGALSPSTAAASSGVSITPPNALELVFNDQSVGSIHLRISDGDQVALSSTDTTATYRVGVNRITVNQSGRADFYLDVPRALRGLRILVGKRLVFSRDPLTRMATDTLTIDLSPRPRG